MPLALPELVRRARGDEPADLLLKNARVVDVFTGEVEPGAVAVAGDTIVGVGDGWRAHKVVDLGGHFVAPGLVDAHVHVESALVRPLEFTRAVVPRGVTTVIADAHEIANVLGVRGLRFMLEDARRAPFTLLLNVPPCVPASRSSTSGAAVSAAELRALLAEPDVLGLAEVMDFPGVVAGEPALLEKLEVYRERVLDGHCPGLSGAALGAYVAAGIDSDHECTTAAEAQRKLRVGMTILIREASGARNLRELLPLVTAATERRFCLCTDDRVPGDLLEEGSVDHAVRLAIAGGLHPVSALRLATLNPAEHYRLRDRGAIAPGRRADLIVFDELYAPRPELVYVAGVLVARRGALLERPAAPAVPADVTGTVHVDFGRVGLRIPAAGRRLRVIRLVPDQLLTEPEVVEATVRDGEAVADPARDLLKMIVVERHGRGGHVGRGFVRGLGLRRGAIASTVAHDHHNLAVIGADDRSMSTAGRRVAELGGGEVVADGERIVASLPLPIAGLMSELPIEVVQERARRVVDAANGLGSRLRDPFLAMSFLGMEMIPKLRLTDLGLVDVERHAPVPLFLEDAP